jgi:predicted ribosomally synthesized peptide with nif11-like leader
MSEEQLKALQEALKTDAALREKLKAAGDADAVVAIAKAAGFMIHAEELSNSIQELSDEELEAVAGGNKNKCWTLCIFSECISVEK